MRTPRLLLVVFVLILLGAGAFAGGRKDAAHPDLSGTWKLNAAKSKIPKGESAGPEIISIKCTDSMILMNIGPNIRDIARKAAGQPVALKDGERDAGTNTTDQWQEFVADGKSHVVEATSGRVVETGGTRLIHLAYWEKSSLITEIIDEDITDARVAIPMTTIRERWTPSKDGARLTRETNSPGPVLVLVYDKAP